MRTLWEAFDVPRPTHAHIHSLSSSHGQTHTYPCVLARRLMDAQPLISRRAPARTQTSPDPLALRLVSRYMWLRGSPKPNRHSLAACNGSIKMVLRKPQTKSAFSHSLPRIGAHHTRCTVLTLSHIRSTSTMQGSPVWGPPWTHLLFPCDSCANGASGDKHSQTNYRPRPLCGRRPACRTSGNYQSRSAQLCGPWPTSGPP